MTSRDPFRSDDDPKPGLSPEFQRIVAGIILLVLVALALLLIF
jgi:hypothetical protein